MQIRHTRPLRLHSRHHRLNQSRLLHHYVLQVQHQTSQLVYPLQTMSATRSPTATIVIVSMIFSAVLNKAPASLEVTTAGVDVALELLADGEDVVCEAGFELTATVVEPEETSTVAVEVISANEDEAAD